MKPAKRTSSSSKKYPPGSFKYKVRKRRIIETLAAFIGGGWLTWEAVHWILVEHYHFPEKLLDITLVTIIGAMLCTLTWRWFGGIKRKRKVKVELILIPLVILAVAVLDVRFIIQMGEHDEEIASETRWKNSIAVLPFANISGDEEQDYFCDGLTEELINRLVNIRDLKVPARTSSFAFKGEKVNIKEVGEKLMVEKVLEGSVRKTGNRIRVTAQLINIADGYHIWSEQYDREMEDIFEIQDDISLMICDKLKIELLGGVRERVLKRHTDNKEAYDSYLRGRWILYNKSAEENWRKAITYYERAIEVDPNFSLAYAGLARIYAVLCYWDFISPNEALPKIKKALNQSLEIDNTLAEAIAELGYMKLAFERDWSGVVDIKRALEINPNSCDIRLRSAQSLRINGQFDEAVKESLRALELDPLSPLTQTNLGNQLYFARRYDEAVKQSKKVIEFNPDYFLAYSVLGFCYVKKSLFQKAISALEKALEFSGKGSENLSHLAYGYAASGNKEKALEILNELDKLSEYKYVSYYYQTFVYATLGDNDKAFECLELAYKDGDYDLMKLKVEPALETLHSDPRYKVMLKKIGLEK